MCAICCIIFVKPNNGKPLCLLPGSGTSSLLKAFTKAELMVSERSISYIETSWEDLPPIVNRQSCFLCPNGSVKMIEFGTIDECLQAFHQVQKATNQGTNISNLKGQKSCNLQKTKALEDLPTYLLTQKDIGPEVRIKCFKLHFTHKIISLTAQTCL